MIQESLRVRYSAGSTGIAGEIFRAKGIEGCVPLNGHLTTNLRRFIHFRASECAYYSKKSTHALFRQPKAQQILHVLNEKKKSFIGPAKGCAFKSSHFSSASNSFRQIKCVVRSKESGSGEVISSLVREAGRESFNPSPEYIEIELGRRETNGPHM